MVAAHDSVIKTPVRHCLHTSEKSSLVVDVSHTCVSRAHVDMLFDVSFSITEISMGMCMSDFRCGLYMSGLALSPWETADSQPKRQDGGGSEQ